jgi:hypothetical protein
MTCVAPLRTARPWEMVRRHRKQLILSALYRYGMAQVWDGSPLPFPGERRARFVLCRRDAGVPAGKVSAG